VPTVYLYYYYTANYLFDDKIIYNSIFQNQKTWDHYNKHVWTLNTYN